MNIYEKLAAVQQELKAPKDKYNSFGEYSYRSLEGINDAVKPLLAKYKALIILTDELVDVGGDLAIKATAGILDTESDGELHAVAYAGITTEKKKLDRSQLYGVASSYARKYAMNALLLIDDTKDPDTDEYAKQTGGEKKDKQPLTEYASEAAIKTIQIMLKKAGLNHDTVLKKPIEELTADEAAKMIIALKKKLGE